ncbi:MAG: hypothetical protein R3C05_21385 [Pirellulaceae bacterium]
MSASHVCVYTSPGQYTLIGEDSSIDGGDVILGFASPIAPFLAELDVNWQQQTS